MSTVYDELVIELTSPGFTVGSSLVGGGDPVGYYSAPAESLHDYITSMTIEQPGRVESDVVIMSDPSVCTMQLTSTLSEMPRSWRNGRLVVSKVGVLRPLFAGTIREASRTHRVDTSSPSGDAWSVSVSATDELELLDRYVIPGGQLAYEAPAAIVERLPWLLYVNELSLPDPLPVMAGTETDEVMTAGEFLARVGLANACMVEVGRDINGLPDPGWITLRGRGHGAWWYLDESGEGVPSVYSVSRRVGVIGVSSVTVTDANDSEALPGNASVEHDPSVHNDVVLSLDATDEYGNVASLVYNYPVGISFGEYITDVRLPYHADLDLSDRLVVVQVGDDTASVVGVTHEIDNTGRWTITLSCAPEYLSYGIYLPPPA